MNKMFFMGEVQEFSLHGRKFVMRDLTSGDVDKYVEFFNGLSEESIQCRFGHLLAKLTSETAEKRIISGCGERALVIFDYDRAQIVAIGRCHLALGEDDAEIAFVVAEAMRRLGLARFLLRQLIAVAEAKNNCKSISGYIATRNAPVIELLKSEGFVLHSTIDDDVKLTLFLKSVASN